MNDNDATLVALHVTWEEGMCVAAIQHGTLDFVRFALPQ
jgi:hypothetical protein